METKGAAPSEINPILMAALEYAARGFCVIPMHAKTKRPAIRWKKYQSERPEDARIRNWFVNDAKSIGVIFGSVSGNLVSRDFDDVQAYRLWADMNPALATALPTVQTQRGFHVYAVANPESVLAARLRLGKAREGTGAIALGDGELRAGVGCYSILPPSSHPSGTVYRWLIPLEDEIPNIDLVESGFASTWSDQCNREHGVRRDNGVHRADGDDRANRSVQRKTDAISESVFKNEQLDDRIRNAISNSLPDGPGQRHRQVFEFARHLRAIPTLTDADPRKLKNIVREWHRQALPHISTKPFEETWIDFLKGWPNVKFPAGCEPLAQIIERATRKTLPSTATQYEQREVRLLVAMCYELQSEMGEDPFYLSCRTAGRILNVSHVQANRWLFLLRSDNVLKLIEQGKQGRAARYKYIAAE